MKYYKLKYADGRIDIVEARSALDVIRKYDLATRANADTRVFQLSGEQEAIARSNDQD